SIVYNAASQTTSLTVGASTANPITENYDYENETGLLHQQTVVRGSTTLLNLRYEYTDSNGKRTGQLRKIFNEQNHDKDRGYSYDALGRLLQATGGQSGSLWTQTYTYDRYGNRTGVSSNGHSASMRDRAVTEPRAVATGPSSAITKPGDPRVLLRTEQLARNNSVELPNDDKPVSDSPSTLRAPSVPPQSGPPTFTDDPLNPPNGPKTPI